jgi:hypothetical protein
VIKGLTEFDLFNIKLVFSFSQFVYSYSLVDFTFFQQDAGVDGADDFFGKPADDFVIICGAYGELCSTYDELSAADDYPVVFIASSLDGAVERAAAASAGGRRC